jgi:hypothetical protein
MNLYHNSESEVAFDYASVTANATGNIIDRQGFEELTFQLVTGAVTTADADNTITVALYESDASDMTGETVVAAADILGDLPVINDATTQDDSLLDVGYVGGKRYVRPKLVIDGTVAANIVMTAIKSDALKMKVSK